MDQKAVYTNAVGVAKRRTYCLLRGIGVWANCQRNTIRCIYERRKGISRLPDKDRAYTAVCQIPIQLEERGHCFSGVDFTLRISYYGSTHRYEYDILCCYDPSNRVQAHIRRKIKISNQENGIFRSNNRHIKVYKNKINGMDQIRHLKLY